MITKKNKTWRLILPFIIFLLQANITYALPFTIVPKAGIPLPTQVILGGSALAYYTVTNNSNLLLSDNYVKYLPPNVTQVVSDIAVPDLCGATFTLAPHGQPNDSCTLELRITGPVSSAGCDIRLHLLVCLAKGITCAGTPNPLDVIGVTLIQPFLAVGNYSLGEIPFKSTLADGTQPALIANTNDPTSWIYLKPTNSPGLIKAANLFDVNCSGDLCVTVGRYTLGEGFQPALLVSQNKGASWRYVFPRRILNITNSSLNSVICNQTHCVVAGYYDTGSGTQMGLANTLDSGATWNLVIPDNSPGPTVDANLNTVRCPGNQCIAVGQYDTGVGGFKPAVIVSFDNGVTWQFVDVVGMPPLTSIALSTVDCTGNTCVAAGQLNNGSVTEPVIIVSNNGGTWHYITPTNTPGTIRTARLRSVRCVNQTCLAVGQYTNTIGGPEQPALIVSTDTAQTWHYVIPSVTLFNDAVILGADCSAQVCAVVGYLNAGAGNQPGIAVSLNAGVNWRLIRPQNSPGTITDSLLNSVLCRDNTCIAVGNYDIGAGKQPAIIRSLDSGVTWQFIYPSNAPGTIVSSDLLSVGCKDNICTAVGLYNLGSGSQPLIIVSADNGATWRFVTPTDPPGTFVSGRLEHISSLP